MNIFTGQELGFLRSGVRLARIATVGADGTPHVTPVGWSYNPAEDALDIGGAALERTKKYRDTRRSPHAAPVIDELVSTARSRCRRSASRPPKTRRRGSHQRISPCRVIPAQAT